MLPGVSHVDEQWSNNCPSETLSSEKSMGFRIGCFEFVVTFHLLDI